MKKKELIKLEVPELTKEMIELAKQDVPVKDTYWNYDKYKYGLYLRAKKEKDYLIVAFFLTEHIRAGGDQPSHVLYIDKKEDKFLTYDMNLERWSNAMLRNYQWPQYVNASGNYIPKEDAKVLEEYFEIEKWELSELNKFQKGVRERALIKRDRKQTDLWDEDLKQIPELPKDWVQWVAKTGIPEHYLFYQYKKGGAKEGYCSHCQKMVSIKSPKYNKKGICSHCGQSVIYKSVGKFGYIHTERYPVYLLQRCKDGVVLRKFYAYASYRSGSYQQPNIAIHEIRRVIYDKDLNEREYYFGDFKHRAYRWIRGNARTALEQRYYSSYYMESGKVYPKTLFSLNKKELKCTGFWEMAKKCDTIDPEFYMLGYKRMPVLEQIVKAGLYNLAKDIYERGGRPDVKARKGELKKILGLDQQRLKRLRILDGGIKLLKWLQAEKEKNIVLKDETITWFLHQGCAPGDFSFIEDRMSFTQIKNYLTRQMELEGENARQVIMTWKDYLSMAERLQMDTHDAIVYRVSKLYKRHEEIIEEIERKNLAVTADEIEKEFKNINRILPELQEKYSYQDEYYTILVPNSILDILNEGKELHHCTDKKKEYFERINHRETYVFFLRKTSAPSQPYYTLEVEPGGVIRQKRTEYSRQYKDIQDAEIFLKKWQKAIQKKLTTEDFKFAEISAQLRNKEYAEIRTKQTRIYGDGFQGELLADILDADLMENSAAA